MSVFEEIKDEFNNTLCSFRYTVIDGKSIYFQGIKSVVKVSSCEIKLQICKGVLSIFGENLYVKKLVGGDGIIEGVITKVETING